MSAPSLGSSPRPPRPPGPAVLLAILGFATLGGGCLAEAELVPPRPDASAVTDAGSVEPGPDSGVPRFHAADYALPDVHGRELKTGALDCRSCHGAQLDVSPTVTCDGCHGGPEWRTDCTFCHGGSEGITTGAPPRDLRGRVSRDEQSFRAHPEHGAAGNHPAYDCNQCHLKPVDVLSVGHVFDDTKGVVEVRFDQPGALSREGQYATAGTCNNLYCHGNGNGRLGSYQHTSPQPVCNTCHGDAASSRTMSGLHRKHLEEGARCVDCHGDTVDAANVIVGAELHVNGAKDVALTAAGMSRTASRCSGTCHLGGEEERHDREDWEDDD